MLSLALRLVVMCLTVVPSTAQLCPSKKLLTFNVGLNPRVTKYESRKKIVPDALKEHTDVDVMCLQEVWYEKDMTNFLNALKPTYPYHYSFIHHAPSQLRSSSGIFSWIFGRFRTAPCLSASIFPLGYCMVRQCKGVKGNAMLGCLTQKCTEQLEAISQDCIACLLMSSIDPLSALSKCVNVLSYYNKMNGQGLLLLSKKPILNVQKTLFFPGVKQMLARGFITADVAGLGKVVCTHLTANIHLPYIEWNKDELKAMSWEEQQRNEINNIHYHLDGRKHILMGDLNTGPAITNPGEEPIVGEYPSNFAALLTYGYTSLYEGEDGRCTWCRDNPLHQQRSPSKILDHIMMTGFNGRNATRTMGVYRGQQLSDHYGMTLNVCHNIFY
ncbi:uncharacterized protein LOC121390193 [Gigantopelta aegis]|uniref:uncharacterized protein LOC121390193 n=1 Tax=Gigantopelta aegis TaxID=1735272 RepID=UPI001B88E5B8|nr:uncharacterized protein LOC121390193 [Gigantopelta aegis]XP_041377886.1 uncharacterized protein LOC121390193 [Gigantopelta aegis]